MRAQGTVVNRRRRHRRVSQIEIGHDAGQTSGHCESDELLPGEEYFGSSRGILDHTVASFDNAQSSVDCALATALHEFHRVLSHTMHVVRLRVKSPALCVKLRSHDACIDYLVSPPTGCHDTTFSDISGIVQKLCRRKLFSHFIHVVAKARQKCELGARLRQLGDALRQFQNSELPVLYAGIMCVCTKTLAPVVQQHIHDIQHQRWRHFRYSALRWRCLNLENFCT